MGALLSSCSHGCLAALDENRLFFAGGRRNNDILNQEAAIYRRYASCVLLSSEASYEIPNFEDLGKKT